MPDIHELPQIMAVAGIAVAAGIAALRPVAGAAGSGSRWLARIAAGTAAAAPVVAFGLSSPLSLVLTVLALTAPALPALLSRATAAGAAGALAAVLLAGYLATTALDPSVAVPATLGYAVQWLAATVWLGGVGHLATGPSGERHRIARRLLPWVLGSAGLVVATAPVTTRGLGLPALAPAVLAAGTLGLLVTVRRTAHGGTGPVGRVSCWGAEHRTTGWWRWLGACGLAVAVVAGGAVVASPLLGSTAPVGVPVLTAVRLAGQPVPVLVVPGRPGWNLVHVGAEGVSAGTDPAGLVAATARPGTRLGWVEVWLPPGPGLLWLGRGSALTSVRIDTGRTGRTGSPRTGPDGPECASAALGRALAGVRTAVARCPADGLSTVDAVALRGIIGFLAARGERSIRLVGDESTRGRLATAVVREAARRAGLTVVPPGADRVPLVVTSGWAAAARAVQDVADGRTAARGTYLAPWLLTAPLLTPAAGQLIPLRFAPDEAYALRYVGQLHGRFPGEAPSSVGYREWSATAEAANPPRLYAASLIQVPGMGGHQQHHGETAGRWLPQGAIVAVTGPVSDPLA